MMGHGGSADAQSFAEFPNAKTGAILRTAALFLTASSETQKDGQPARMSESLEDQGIFFDVHISITIALSLFCRRK
jgi:hypothetical protein